MSVAFQTYGVSICVSTGDPSLLDRIPAYLPYGWKPIPAKEAKHSFILAVDSAPGTARSYSLERAEEEIVRSGDVETVLDTLERHVRWIVADNAPERIFVHAGVAGWRGRAVLLPGTSGVGKSTLVAELVRAGARYYSDEYAVLDARGRVHPFATPLQLRHEGDLRQTKRSVESLGGRPGRNPLPVALVVAAVHTSGARTRLRKLSQAQGMLELLKNVAARPRPYQTIDVLAQVSSQARILVGERGEAEEFALELLAMLDTCDGSVS